MERFAINIDNSFKTNIFKICRLCGIDSPHKVSVLEEVVSLLDGEDELPLYKKIFNCIGIQVAADDKMPKTICALCFDKINDFHEFREMCYSTNAQTRKLLGLQPQVEKKWNLHTFLNPIASEQLDSLQKRNSRKRKTEDIPPDIKFDNKMIKIENQPTNYMSNLNSNKNQFNVIKTERDIILDKKGGKKLAGPPVFMCNICQVNFCSATILQSHLLKVHVPIIARYHCIQCNVTIGNSLEIKNHNLWHRLSKTPFKCGRCDKTVVSLQGLTRHMRECSKKIIRTAIILPNVECKYCSVEFETKNLYFMHNCVTSKLRCPKCNCKMSNPITTLKHIASCSVQIKADYNRIIDDDFIIKNEPIDLPNSLAVPLLAPISSTLDVKPSLVINNPSMVVIPQLSSIDTQVTKDNSKKSKMKKDTEDAIRRCDELLKNTMKTLVSIKHEPAEDNTISTQLNLSESIITTINQQTSSNPKLGNTKTIGQSDLPAVRIKQEIINEGYRDVDTNIEINIKQEITEKVQPALKLKIKKEHGTLNASFIQNDNSESGNGDGCCGSGGLLNHIIETNKNNDGQLIASDLIIAKPKKTASTLPVPIKIKQEVIEKENSDQENELPPGNDDFHHGDYDSDDDNDNSINDTANQQDNTNIPIISSVKSVNGSKSNEKTDKSSQNKNVIHKSTNSIPMLTISSVSSAGNIVKTTNNEIDTTKSIDENNLNERFAEAENTDLLVSTQSFIPQILSVSGGVDLISNNENLLVNSENQNIDNNFVMPQISLVSAGVELPPAESTKMNNDDYNSNFSFVQIKKEKIDPGYKDPYDDANQMNTDDQEQSAENSDINNMYQYDMNFVGAVRIKQEMEFAEEGFGDEVQSEYSEDYNNSDNENDNNGNDREMQQIENNDMTKIKDNDENVKNLINNENNENYNSINDEIQNRINLQFSLSTTDTNFNNNFNNNLTNDFVNNPNFIDSTNKLPIISQVSSININDYNIQNINNTNNKSEYSESHKEDEVNSEYSESHKEESLNQNYIDNLMNSNDNNCNILEDQNSNPKNNENLINSINHPISSTSSSNNSILEPAVTVPEYKNINEIAENHNNENFEKLLRNEITQQIVPQLSPATNNENDIPNLAETVERHQEIDENILNNANNESINIISNSNIILDNNINVLPPID